MHIDQSHQTVGIQNIVEGTLNMGSTYDNPKLAQQLMELSSKVDQLVTSEALSKEKGAEVKAEIIETIAEVANKAPAKKLITRMSDIKSLLKGVVAAKGIVDHIQDIIKMIAG